MAASFQMSSPANSLMDSMLRLGGPAVLGTEHNITAICVVLSVLFPL
jgi:hypothetical protein